jgi:spore germination protein GerM
MKKIAFIELMLVIIGIGLFYFFPRATQEVNNEDKSVSQVEINLYFYDENKDKDAEGNILCSSEGLVAVSRTILKTVTPMQDAIKLLLKEQPTDKEKAQGLSSFFPLNGVELVGANLSNGVLALEFSDPSHQTSGGSCKVSIMRSQIEKTAMQFDEVESIILKPDEAFQP